jgi:hypothetical protein
MFGTTKRRSDFEPGGSTPGESAPLILGAAEEHEGSLTRWPCRRRIADRIVAAGMGQGGFRNGNERNREAHIGMAAATANRQIDPLAGLASLGLRPATPVSAVAVDAAMRRPARSEQRAEARLREGAHHRESRFGIVRLVGDVQGGGDDLLRARSNATIVGLPKIG